MGSAVWWWKLSSFCCGSTCSLCKWTHCHLGSSSVWCSEPQKPHMREFCCLILTLHLHQLIEPKTHGI
uniref:Secreted protein n=1 Tax=Cucumis sativus TaxID=3659 RepID=A0A0A0LRX3_CUCSA